LRPGLWVAERIEKFVFFPSLSNCGRWVWVQDFQDSDSKGFLKGAAVIESVFKNGEVRNV